MTVASMMEAAKESTKPQRQRRSHLEGQSQRRSNKDDNNKTTETQKPGDTRTHVFWPERSLRSVPARRRHARRVAHMPGTRNYGLYL